MALISAVAWLSVMERQTPAQWVVDLCLGLLCWGLVWFRRRRPLLIALAIVALSSFSGLAVGPAALATVSLVTRRRPREIVLVVVANWAAGIVWTLTQPVEEPTPLWVELALNAVIVAAMVAWGLYIGSRRELVATLRQRAERAESEQALRVREAQGDERERIAREMHDVLAHRISHISMRAGALEFRTDLPAEEMRAGIALIHQQANAALDELRQVLGVLRGHDGEPLHRPQPTYADVAGLVEEARGAGLEVTFTDRLAAPVPDAAGRALFRIVQEGITNARKHAPAATLQITISGTPEDGIVFDLVNPLGFQGASQTPGAGLGLIGLAERAAQAGGWLEHHRDTASFRLNGWIPWSA